MDVSIVTIAMEREQKGFRIVKIEQRGKGTPDRELTTCQAQALNVLSVHRNIFLTGAAGTGKSYLVQEFLRDKDPDLFPIVASTGAAAILVNGRTFHSFFGLGIMEGGRDGTVRKAMKNKKLIDRLRFAEGIVIDEVSMLSGTALSVAECIARMARRSEAPWGGLKIIAVGDFAQLPPVSTAGMHRDWAFTDDVWVRSSFHPAVLRSVVRTTEPEFLHILGLVRQGIVTPEVSDFLNAKRKDPAAHFEGTRLFAHRISAERFNLERLENIPAPLKQIETMYEGDARSIEQLQRNAPVPQLLQLKTGALVMLRKNDIYHRYANGTLGYVISVNEDTLDLELLDGREIQVGKTYFSQLDGDGKETATAWNFPVNLAWASTIHKAQGASLDRMMVDLSRVWEPGHAYTALSRVRSHAGLFIENWKPSCILAEPLVQEFYKEMEA